MPLTQEELDQLEKWIQASSVGNMALERPVSSPVAFLDSHPNHHSSLLGAAPKLSETTRRKYQEEARKRQKKKEFYEKRKLPTGRFHHRKKEATQRRMVEKRWATQPLKSLTYGYGSWDISQEEWDKHLGRFWQEYPSNRLHVKRKWGHGTKASPYRIWHLKLYYQHTGKPRLLWDGSYLEDLYLTAPNELDLSLAHEGAELFLSTDRELMR